MKRLGFSLLLSLAVFGSVAAQTGSKHVDLKEITDGKFRQVSERCDPCRMENTTQP